MSIRQFLINPKVIPAILVLQFVPLVLFPPESFSATTQEWWLPVLMAVLIMIAIVQIFRRATTIWPWNLLSFAQGLNIISRLMMILPHATRNENGAQFFNTPYVVLSLIAMLLSAFMLWYTELPDVRLGFLRN